MINKSKRVETQPKNIDKGLEVVRKKSMMLCVHQHFWPDLTAVVNSHRKVDVQYFLILSFFKSHLSLEEKTNKRGDRLDEEVCWGEHVDIHAKGSCGGSSKVKIYQNSCSDDICN